MQMINNPKMLAQILETQGLHFRTMPPVLHLFRFEKGELLCQPLNPLEQFLLIIEGHITIYSITSDGDMRYITRSGSGTLLGDMEFNCADCQILYAEAMTPVLCLSIPFHENRSILENDPEFLRFVMRHLTKKLSQSSQLDAIVQTLENKILLYLKIIEPSHEIRSVNETMQVLHCSRRQLQRVLKKLCDEKKLIKTERGHYHLNES